MVSFLFGKVAGAASALVARAPGPVRTRSESQDGGADMRGEDMDQPFLFLQAWAEGYHRRPPNPIVGLSLPRADGGLTVAFLCGRTAAGYPPQRERRRTP